MPEPLPRLPKGLDEELVLIHAGRFSGSDARRTPDILLAPLLQNLSLQPSKGVVRLIGSLSDDELKLIAPFKPQFQKIGWRIECPGSMPRDELLKLLPQADGLLLLSASYAALPSKLFEYIPTGKPIFAVTEKGNAAWRVAEQLPQASLINILGKKCGSDNVGMQSAFYLPTAFVVREEYSETALCMKFKEILQWIY